MTKDMYKDVHNTGDKNPKLETINTYKQENGKINWCMHTLEHYAAMKLMQTPRSNLGQYVITVSKTKVQFISLI